MCTCACESAGIVSSSHCLHPQEKPRQSVRFLDVVKKARSHHAEWKAEGEMRGERRRGGLGVMHVGLDS